MAGREGERGALAALQRRLQRAHAPVVLALGTENANLVAARSNGLTLTEMLAPFGEQETTINFRTPTRSYGLRDFRIEFATAAELEPISFAVAEAALHDVVQAEAPRQGLDDAMRSGPEDSADLPRFVRAAHKQPWYEACRDTIPRTFQHHETEMFGSPVASLLVASTADADPRSCFQQLMDPHFFPTAFQYGQYDPNVPKFYVLLHDASDPRVADVDVKAMADALRNFFPPHHFHFVALENNRDPGAPSRASLWAPFVGGALARARSGKAEASADSDPKPPPGAKLSDADIDTLRRFVHNLVVSGVCVALENRLVELDNNVTAQRKGLRNTFRSFWRKPKEGAEAAAASHLASPSASSRRVRYLHDSIESNIRLLADLAFMMQDYDLALSMYRIARDDFASDKESLHQGSALEMMAVCNLIRGSPARDTLDYVRRSHACFKDAVNAARPSQSAQAPLGTPFSIAARFLTKSTILFVDVVLAFGGSARLYRESTELLARASLEETSLCAAILLEQTGIFLVYQELASTGTWSFSSLHARHEGSFRGAGGGSGTSGEVAPHTMSRRLRKFGFHMVMAGLLYKKDRQVEHALRCLATVRNLYHSSRWKHINDHLAFTMAEHAAALNDLEHALPLWAEVLERGDEAQRKQATIMDEMEHHMNTQETFDPDADWPFSLPIIDDARIGVHRALNPSILPEVTSLRPDYLLVAPEDDVNTGASESARTHATREALKVTRTEQRRREETEWSQLHQFLDHASPRPEGVQAEVLDAAPRRSRRGKRQQLAPQVCYAGEPVYVDLPLRNPCALKLPISEVQLIAQLVDTDGHLLTGEAAAAAIELPAIDKLVLDESSERMVRLHVLPKQAGALTIIGAQWRLFGKARVRRLFEIRGPRILDTKEDRVAGARAQDLRLQKTVRPAAAWLGAELDLAQTVFEGETVQTTLELINLGASPCVGNIVVGTNAPTLCVGSSASETGNDVVGDQLAPVLDDGGRAFEIPVKNLVKGLPMSVPVVIRMPSAGHVSLRLLLRYHDGAALRYVRLSHSVEVLPSIRMAARCLASPLPGSDHLLCCNVSNASTRTVCLRRVVAFSGSWEVSPLGSGPQEEALLAPRESRSFLVRVARVGGSQTERHELRVSDVSFREHPEWQLGEDDAALAPSFHSRLHFICAEYASSVLEARTAAKRRFEYFKDKLDAEGKLPVSIQSIRRLKEAGSQDPEMDILAQLDAATKPSADEPRPCDQSALCFGPRGELLHLMLEWTATSNPAWAFGHAEELNIAVLPERPLKISLEHAQACAGKILPVTFCIENVSADHVRSAIFQIDNGKDVSWRGFTRLALPDLKPGDAHSLKLLASFHTSGLVDLGVASVFAGEDAKPVAQCSSSFVSVTSSLDPGSSDAGYGPPFAVGGMESPARTEPRVQQEPSAPINSPPPPPPFAGQPQDASFMWTETSHADRPPMVSVGDSAQAGALAAVNEANITGERAAPADHPTERPIVQAASSFEAAPAQSGKEGSTPTNEDVFAPASGPENAVAASASEIVPLSLESAIEEPAAPLASTEGNETPRGLLDEPSSADVPSQGSPPSRSTLEEGLAVEISPDAFVYGDENALAEEQGPDTTVEDGGSPDGEAPPSPSTGISKRTSSLELESALREELGEDEGEDSRSGIAASEDEDEEEFLKDLEQELSSP